MVEKIKDIYNCEKMEGDDPLVNWYNMVIEKRVDELTISDVARCIRQNLFIDTAVEMMLVYLIQNPYEGDIYDGELIEKIGELDLKHIKKHINTISKIIEEAGQFIESNEWYCDENKNEYKESVDKLSEIIDRLNV